MTEPEGPARVDPQHLLAQLQRVRDAQVGEALRLLEERREALADAREAVEAARDEVHRALRRLGAAQVAAQEQPPVELLRELDWEQPEVRVDQMVAAFGFRHIAEVAALGGPDERPLPCHGGCGRTVRRQRKNRTDTTYRRGAQDPSAAPQGANDTPHPLPRQRVEGHARSLADLRYGRARTAGRGDARRRGAPRPPPPVRGG